MLSYQIISPIRLSPARKNDDPDDNDKIPSRSNSLHLFHLSTHAFYRDMTGTKRSWEGNPVVDKTKPSNSNNADAAMDEPSSKVLSIFGTFRDELDEHHDRRERIIKTSRDITALSKKMLVSHLSLGVCVC